MKKTTLISVLLVAGILLVLNILSFNFFQRIDFTEDKQYTLSDATKNILKNLETPVTINAYFSQGINQQIEKNRRDFKEMLLEYKNLSNGMLDYSFVDPGNKEDVKQEALADGVPELVVNVVEKDQAKKQKAFMGAVVKVGEQKEVMPAIASTEGLEYNLTTNVKKLTVTNKPVIGIVQGHGEPSLQELGQVYQSLSILYTVAPVDLGSGDLSTYKAIAIVAPKDSLPPDHIAGLDNYLNNGGKLLLALNRVEGNLQSRQGTLVNTGLETWLQGKGISVEPSFILDNQCGAVTVQQQQGIFIMNTQVKFPYLPLVTAFPDHPVTNGLEQVILPFASPVTYAGTGSFTPLIYTSSRAATSPAPTVIEVVDKDWSAADFMQSNIAMGGIVTGDGLGSIIVFGDGDFAVTGQGGRGQNEDNISLLVNSIDFLCDDTGLIELRTKGIASRPISEEYLGDENIGKRDFMKYLNFGLPILLVFAVGLYRSQKQKSMRIKRLQENYS